MTEKQYKFIDNTMVEMTADEIADLEQHRERSVVKDNLLRVRSDRKSLLEEADYKINMLVDNNQDASAWRTYRQALRDVTTTSNLEFPTKPS